MNAIDLKPRLEFAQAIAREAGQSTLRHYRHADLRVEIKSDASPVTVADREAEQLLRQRIEARFPDDGILGEEFGEVAGKSGYRWILDPIDGTKSFICGVPLYGTLVGVECDGRSQVGAIYFPGLDEGIYAASGQGAWVVRGANAATRARVAEKTSLDQAVFCTSAVETFDKYGRGAIFERLRAASWLTRTWGDCYGYYLVATGGADLMVDPQMSLWDCAALQPVLEEAGGTFTDFRGTPTIHAQEAIATNGKLLPQVLELCRE